MGWRWRDSRLWFKKNVDCDTKAVSEVGPRIVIGDDLLTMKRQQRSAPFLQLRVDRRLKFFVVRLVKCGVRRIQSGKRLRDVLRNRLGNNRINSEMRISERVNITRSSCDICWHVHEANAL